MERTLTPDERIRRAEEIYYRKKIQANYPSSARVNVGEKPNFNLLRKMGFQLIVCVLIYSSFYLIGRINHDFSNNTINGVRGILSYNMDINGIYNALVERVNGWQLFGDGTEEEVTGNDEDDEDEEDEEETEMEDHYYEENIEGDGYEDIDRTGVGGPIIENSDEISSLSQMELDAKKIIENYYLGLPLTGVITSRFGYRISPFPNVSGFHTGIDIAANTGTMVASAMDGVVIRVSGVRWLSEII
ncbi:MAG: hypothetical protein FWC79_03935 [Oscillospiraceae bacterium]|nr:hypothetical protein [Oscillospiraceae bacterium]